MIEGPRPKYPDAAVDAAAAAWIPALHTGRSPARTCTLHCTTRGAPAVETTIIVRSNISCTPIAADEYEPDGACDKKMISTTQM